MNKDWQQAQKKGIKIYLDCFSYVNKVVVASNVVINS